MAVNYRLWEGILLEVDSDKDLEKDNLIDKISDEFQYHSGDFLSHLEFSSWKGYGDVNGLFEVVDDLLVQLGGQVESDKLTLLHLAVKFNLKNIVNALLDIEGINVNAVDNHKRTPLHHAFSNDYQEIVEILLKNKANVNSADENRCTSLHYAAQWGCIDIVKVLLENEADPLLKDEYGRTPRDLATSNSIKKFLEEAEEKQLKKLNKEKDKLPQDKDDNKDTTPLPKETEKKQPTSAAKKGVFAGSVVIALGTAAAVALFATGTVAVELTSILIAVAAVTVAALTVGSITYMLSDPSVEQVAGNERKV